MLYELGEQASEPHADLAAERADYWSRSLRAADWIAARSPRVQDGMRILTVRCQAKGCHLAEVFRLPLPDGGERFLGVTRTVRGTGVSGFLNWAFTDSWWEPMYLPSGCRHGHHRLSTGWLVECVSLVRGWHHALTSLEETRSQYPPAMQRCIARRTFHPEMQVAWRQSWGTSS